MQMTSESTPVDRQRVADKNEHATDDDIAALIPTPPRYRGLALRRRADDGAGPITCASAP